MSDALLACRGLAVRRGDRTVVSDATLEVRGGDAVALVGPNAAGKSTLLRAMNGLLPAASGRVEVMGRALDAWSPFALARVLALVGPEDEGATLFTVRERVALGRYPHLGPFRRPGREDESAVDRALHLAGIEHLASRRVGQLSAGERQLAALARGLAQQPRVLLLDEPASHLDIGHQLALYRVLDGIRADGVGVLAVVHDLQRAASWCGRMLLLDGGRIVAEGPPEEVLLRPECGRAFGVSVTAQPTTRGERLYGFREAADRP